MKPTPPSAATSSTATPWRALFISWGKLHRADTIAARLGIPSYTIRYFYRGYRGTPLPLTVLKYFLQAIHTIFLCILRRPRVVFVTHPPLFAVVAVYLYAVVFRARCVIDFHSGCFIQEHWRRWDRWQRFLARRAALNLVHNADNAKVVEEWGAAYEILPSLPPQIEPALGAGKGTRPLAVYICSFKEDEPVDALLDAARGLPEVDFSVTGRAPAGLSERLPANVRLTGFLSDDDYVALLSRADAVIALTLRSGTLVYGAQEAIALHKPLVLSGTQTLREYFASCGAVFSENTPDGLRVAIRDALSRRVELVDRMAKFQEQYLAEGQARLARIRARLEVPQASV